MRDLYVLDIETTGLGGALMGDVIVEIGIARVDIDRKKVFPEYGKIIHQDLTEQQKKSWVFENTDLDPEDVERSPWSTDDIILDLALYSQGVFTYAVLEGFILLRYLEDDPDGLRAYMTALEGF